MLEIACLEAFAGEPDRDYVEDYLNYLSNLASISPTTLQKARMQVFLASKGAELRFQIAVKQSWWPWKHAAFNQVKAFLKQISELP